MVTSLVRGRLPDGTYGGRDQTVSWPSPRTVRISAMQPWEAKLIRIS
jgi:hypothetical protein